MRFEHTGDMVDADAYSVDELREAVFEGRGRVARPLALALLTRKDYRQKVTDLRTILTDDNEQPRLRALAASGLGEVATPASVRALERGLQSHESVTMRASAKALANIGTRKHVELLQAIAQSPGPVGRDAQRALTLLSERLRSGGAERASVRTLPVRATDSPSPIRTKTPDAGEVADAIKALPSRKLARRAAVALECQGRKLIFVFDETALGQGVDMVKRGGEIGIVAEPPGVEGRKWYPRYRVAVEPQTAGKFDILVTAQDGRTLFAGRGAIDGREARFELAAADVPGALPVEIRGRFDGKKVTFEEARSVVRRRASRNPTSERREPL